MHEIDMLETEKRERETEARVSRSRAGRRLRMLYRRRWRISRSYAA